jgi:sugar-phosphatase
MTPTLPRPVRAIVFDMDGVLVDSEPLWHQAEIEVFGRFGVRLTPVLCLETTGVRVDDVVRHWERRFPDAFVGVAHGDVIAAIIDGVVERVSAAAEAMAGVVDVLQCGRRLGLPMGVASSSPRPIIDAVLRRLDVGDAFDVVCSAWELPHGKPDPAVYLQACGALGVAPEDALAVEDSHSGLLAAMRAGMMVVAIPDPRAHRPAAADDADVVLSDLGELSALLRDTAAPCVPRPTQIS